MEDEDGDLWRDRDLLARIVEEASDLVAVLDEGGRIVYANAATQILAGHSVADLVGRVAFDFVHPDDLDRAATVFTESYHTGAPASSAPFRLVRADGSAFNADVKIVRLSSGEMALTARPSEEGLLTSAVLEGLIGDDPFAEVLADVIRSGVWRSSFNLASIVRFAGGAPTVVQSDALDPRLTGAEVVTGSPWEQARRTRREVIVEACSAELPGGLDADRRSAGLGECWIVPVEDRELGTPALLSYWTLEGASGVRIHEYSVRTAERLLTLCLRWRHWTTEIAHRADHDVLTGLPNRRLLERRAARLHRVDRDGPAALLLIDLDAFKPVNDDYGHRVGDDVLAEVGKRLRASVRPDDLVVRLGGDEFVVLCTATRPDATLAVATRIRLALRAPIEVRGVGSLVVRASIGISALDPTDLAAALDAADGALYSVKRNGGDDVRWADPVGPGPAVPGPARPRR